MRKRLIYQVAVGPQRPLWTRCLESMAVYAKRHGIDYHLQTEPILRIAPERSHRSASALKLGYLPNLEKLAALARLADYDALALIDADVYALPDAPDVFDALNRDADFAAVVEREMAITPAYARKLDAYSQGQYGHPQFPFFNCGVELFNQSMVRHLCGQTPTEFLRRPEFADFINGKGNYRWASEQTLMNVWVRSCGASLQHLAPKWNVLFGAVTAPADAAFVHFFLSAHLTSDDPQEMLRTGKGRARV